ncbi:hypothetical protein AAFC00_004896 [Neodothiora populina]|uniref:Uncharacterized protein n=1 Tax=Neodothiora populina TaxID=2781224 RepID=A0ABR3P3Q4_9PEZI
MAGYRLEIKRNYDCSPSQDLRSLVLLGDVDVVNIHEPTSKAFVRGDIARGTLERQAATIPPPPKGQNIRAPVDGINTKRCQEWTMDFLNDLVRRNLIGAGAVEIAQRERDPPTHGIFDYNQARP